VQWLYLVSRLYIDTVPLFISSGNEHCRAISFLLKTAHICSEAM
jgi:hypothetical protein